jgi:DNA polymerase-3 subunit epsilon
MPLPVQRSFDDLGAPLFDVPFCVLDIETTGGSPSECAITELGAIRYRGGEVEGTFHTLVNPGTEIPAFITVLTGITHAMVVEAPPIDEVLPAFLEFCGEAVIVGHNVRFDLSFLNAACERLGYPRLPRRSVDTLALARRLVRAEVRRLDLSSLAAYFGSPVKPTHRALEDARATAHVLWSLMERAGTIGVTHLDDLLTLPTARGAPTYRKLGLTDGLPRRPGVYLFKDRAGRVIYVGKAKDLRSRVRSYFYGDERRSVATMLRELAEIDHRVCATELEAEVAELRLIQAHRPRHNRRSRPGSATHWVVLTEERFPRLSMARKLRPEATAALGPFRGRAAARRVVEALWDALPVRRCTGPPGRRASPCAFAQLGVALCPCDGSLDASSYREVVDRLIAGVESDPGLLLAPLDRKIAELAARRRFEEAAWVRDRRRSLATALERRRAWATLRDAGMVRAEASDGSGAALDRGRLVAAWADRSRPPLVPASPDGPSSLPPVPESLADAEEAHLVWRWLTSGRVRLVDASAPLAMPARPVPILERIAV